MSNYFGIEQALIDAYIAASAGMPTGYTGAPLSDTAKGEGIIWADVHNMRALSEPATLGDKGEDNHPGFLQIDLNIDLGAGSGTLLQKADTIASAFPAGHKLTYNGQVVTITSTSVGPSRYVGKWNRISVTLYYYARTVRNP